MKQYIASSVVSVDSLPDPSPTGKSVYYLHKFEPSDSHCYDNLFRDLDKAQEKLQTEKQSFRKRKFNNDLRIYEDGDYNPASSVPPYLEHNAGTWGDLESQKNDLSYALNLSAQCKKSVVWFVGENTGNHYIKQIECRKHWCPDCGGKGGHIHKNRIHSILNRMNIDEYNIRQFVLTIPESLRQDMKSRANLDRLEKYAKDLTEKFFGEPQFDRLGHVKKYKLKKGAISYLHLFGDNELGVLKPHINLHVLESKDTKMILSDSILESIKKFWLKKLKNFDESLTAADVHYKFRIKIAHKLHAIKYMSRPWGLENMNSVDDETKRFLVFDMAGFKYVRFWGALANCNYKDEMTLPAEKEKCEKIINEELKAIFISSFDMESWKKRLIKIDDGFYRVLKGGENEPETSKERTKNDQRTD